MFLALPQDVHDWALKSFTTTRKGEEGRGSRRPVVRTEGYPLDQLFNVEHSVHRKSVAGGMMAILSEGWVTNASG